ncbi:MAG: cupredoxin domain-containing protein [Armatimonadetes bacterium]|nr:cupredoxin domain-containing protein [Armatimonadota bacterium]
MSKAAWVLLLTLTVSVARLGVVMIQPASSGQAPIQVVQVEMKEFTFTPKALVARPGQVKISVVNKGMIEHNLVVPALRNVTTKAVPPGKSAALDLTVGPGTHQIVCDVPGHREAGMVATLTVR